jgi:exosortase/archaeosortase family protein
MTLWRVIAVLVVLLGFAASSYVVGKVLKREKGSRFVWFFVRCVAVFALLLGCETAIGWLFPSYCGLLRDSAAAAVGGILHLVDMHNSVTGSIIWIDSCPIAFDITTPCLGGVLFLTYIALVFAQPSVTRGQRLAGLFGGLVVLSLFNIGRIAFTVYVEGSTGGYVHNLFYYFNMVVVVLVWAGWVRTFKPAAATPVRVTP